MTTQELKQYIDMVLGNNIRCLLPSYWWKKLFGEVVDNIDTVSKSTKTSINSLSSKIEEIASNTALYVDVTYDELVQKKINAKLVPGQLYRITDYECTINDNDPDIVVLSEDDTRYNKFCIIVEALTKTQLSESAKAVTRLTDINGIDSKTSLEIKYTIANDPEIHSWARMEYKSYDVVTSYQIEEYSNVRFGCFYWDKNNNKYVEHDVEKYSYLVNSLTDSTPLQETTFNYGDIIYVKYFDKIIETTVLYTDNMKDTGEGVLINYRISNNDPYYYRPFVWSDTENTYIFKTSDGYDALYDSNLSPVEKRSSFVKNEEFTIRQTKKYFKQSLLIPNFDVILEPINTDLNPKDIIYPFIWNEELSKYVGSVDSTYYLGTSSTDSTPMQKKEFTEGEWVFMYGNNFMSAERVAFTKETSTNKLVFDVDREHNQGITLEWSDDRNCYYADSLGYTLVFEDGSIVPKDYDFNSDKKYGTTYTRISSGSLGNTGITTGFYVPIGKGVIYYMKDRKGNEAPYDFKHILFRFPDVDENPRFTFHNNYNVNYQNMNMDASEGNFSDNARVCGNKINKYIDSNDRIQYLNKVSLDRPTNVIVSSEVYNNCISTGAYRLENVYIGLNSNRELSIVNIYDKSAISADSEISDTSENPIQNKVIKNYVDNIKEEILSEVVNNEEVIATAFSESIKKFDNVHESINEVKDRITGTLVININRNDGTFTINDSDVSNVYNAIVLINGLSNNSSILYSRSSPRNIFLDLMTGVISFSCHDAYTIENGILTSIQYKCSVTLNHDTGTVESIVGTKISTKLNSDNITYNIESINLLNDEVISSREFNIPITNVESI